MKTMVGPMRFSHYRAAGRLVAAILFCSLQVSLIRGADQQNSESADLAHVARRAVSTDGVGFSVRGAVDGWWFLRGELEHLAEGVFWEGDLGRTTVTGVDPVPFIARYAEEMKALGVRLILCPIPPKAAIYPEKLSAELAAEAGGPLYESVEVQAPFLKKLSDLGVEVLDLEPVLRDQRATSDTALYCAQDSHWSPFTCRLAAGLLADRIRDEACAVAAREAFGETIFTSDDDILRIHGDLVTDSDQAPQVMEELAVRYVGSGSEAVPVPLEIDPSSPVLVVGDSHTLVFSEGAEFGMHARGAGVVDHLAAELGFPLDREASRGSGGDSARANVARRSKSEADLWQKKKVVLWIFSSREFSRGKWRHIPANVD